MSESPSCYSRPKKRKTLDPNHHACSACKARKVKCDAATPRCSYCTQHDKACLYPPVYRRATCSQRHVDEIEARLRQFETSLASNFRVSSHSRGAKDGQASSPAPPNGADVNSQPRASNPPSYEAVEMQDSSPLAQQVDPTQPSTRESVRRHPVDLPPESDNGQVPAQQDAHPESSPYRASEEGDDNNVENTDVSPVMDGMVEYIGPSPQATEQDGAFRDSSTFNFALKMQASAAENESSPSVRRGMTSTAAQMLGAEASDARPSTTGFGAAETPKAKEQEAHDEVVAALRSYLDQTALRYLPQRHVAVALLDQYFLAVHPIWPFLDEEITRKNFEQTWSSNNPPSPMWMSQLNLVFALACQFYNSEDSAPLADIYEAGKQFYQRGNGFVIAHAFHVCSVPMLQTLLLMAQYQQGTMRTNECWLTIGHATRMALGLGLHTSSEDNHSGPPLGKELRKRLWWGCFSLDRVSSMIYGRPIGIPHMRFPHKQADLPLAIDDKHISLGENQPNNVPSINAFFLSSVQLYQVMDKILERLLDTQIIAKADFQDHVPGEPQELCGCSAVSQLTAILQLDGLLLSWHEALPAHLRFSLDGVEMVHAYPPSICRQRTILQNRFLGMRILLHRQTLLFLLQPSESRRWPRNESQKWPPLFSDLSGSSPVICRHDASSGKSPSPTVDRQLAYLSASICVSMAQLQIEQIDLRRPMRLTGAWWWDFHCEPVHLVLLKVIFNSLCVMFGTIGLPAADLTAILPDLSRGKMLIQRGFENIRHMSARAGPRVAQSESFLRRLMATMSGHGRMKKSSQQNNRSNGHPIPSGLSYHVNAVLPSKRPDFTVARIPSGSADTDCAPLGIASGRRPDSTPETVDFSDLANILSWPGMEEDFPLSNLAVNGNADTMENLIYNSFEAWNPLGGSFHPVTYDFTSAAQAPPATAAPYCL